VAPPCAKAIGEATKLSAKKESHTLRMFPLMAHPLMKRGPSPHIPFEVNGTAPIGSLVAQGNRLTCILSSTWKSVFLMALIGLGNSRSAEVF